MPDLSNFCTPDQEMDAIARKMREGEKAIDYSKLFRDVQIAGAGRIFRPEDEMDWNATSARYQSEPGPNGRVMSAEDANRAARRVHNVMTPENFQNYFFDVDLEVAFFGAAFLVAVFFVAGFFAFTFGGVSEVSPFLLSSERPICVLISNGS